jgi:hypothetical protein
VSVEFYSIYSSGQHFIENKLDVFSLFGFYYIDAYIYMYIYMYILMALQSNVGRGVLILDVSRSHTTHHTR